MQYQPKTEKQIREELLLPNGIYDFEVFEAADKVSKGGNDMIYLKLKVYTPEGNFRFVDDYLLEAMAFKLRHAAVACGLGDQYATGTLLASHFVGKSGQVKLRIDVNKDGKYQDKNAIADYVVPKEGELGPAEMEIGKPIDDQIPF